MFQTFCHRIKKKKEREGGGLEPSVTDNMKANLHKNIQQTFLQN
jgi:hypothetical protein